MKNHFQLLYVLLAALFIGVVAQPAFAQANKPRLVVPGQVVLYLRGGSNAAEAARLAADAGCDVLGEIAYSPGFYLLEVKGTSKAAVPTSGKTRAETPVALDAKLQAVVDKLRTSAGVLADPNFVVTGQRKQASTTPATFIPNDPLFPRQWNMRLINMPTAWTYQFGTRTTTLAIVDTGLDLGHPEFAGRVVATLNTTNPTAPTTNVDDRGTGHGTAVAGIAAANTNNATGVTGVAGYMGGGVTVNLVIVRALGDDGSGSLASIIAAVSALPSLGVNVANFSLGGQGRSDTETAAFQSVIAQGVFIVAALGNSATDTGAVPFTPANIPGVFAVSSVGPTGALASYSNFGGSVALTAPGGAGEFNGAFPVVETSIISSYPRGLTSQNGVSVIQDGYAASSGTSEAAPHVAGAAALLYAVGVPTSELRAALQSTARRLDEVPNANGGNNFGAGLLDVAAALEPYVLAAPTLIGSDGRSVTPSGQPINDQGTTLDRNVPIAFSVRGLQKLAAPSNIVVTLTRLGQDGATVVDTFVGGVDFDVPAVTTANAVTITVPRASRPQSPRTDGRYRIDVTITNTLNGATVIRSDVQFATIRSQVQPRGRSLFTIPFTAAQGSTTPEAAVLGQNGTLFTLFRWDVFTGTYASFISNGGQNTLASFRVPTLPDGRFPSYDTTNPGVNLSPVGLGYWLNTDQDTVLSLVGSRVNNPVAVSLVGPTAANPGGWNLVGNPYTFAVDWNSVSVVDGGQSFTLQQAVDTSLIKRFIVGYEPSTGDYYFGEAPSGQLRPFNGYWVQALRDVTLIFTPAVSQFPENTRAAHNNLNLSQPAGGWRARISASVAGDHDGQNYFGQVSGATLGEDKHDISKPPSGAGHAYVRFVANAANGKKTALAADMRPAGSKQEWTVAVTSDKSNADVTLTWDGLNAAPRRSRFTLRDGKTGARIPLGSRSSYTFPSGEAGSTRLFTLNMDTQGTAGALGFINPHLVKIGRSSQGMVLRFRVNREVEVQGFVKTTGGKVIAPLLGDSRAAGSQEVTLRWDGKNEKGAPTPIGGYVLEVVIRDETGESATLRQPVMQVR